MFLYVFVVFFFWIFAIFSNRGFAGNFQLRAVASEARTQHEEASVENDALRNSIHSLKNDDAAIEKIAREKLRMVKPGETVYIFHDK